MQIVLVKKVRKSGSPKDRKYEFLPDFQTSRLSDFSLNL
jgi:hypothetical protein